MPASSCILGQSLHSERNIAEFPVVPGRRLARVFLSAAFCALVALSQGCQSAFVRSSVDSKFYGNDTDSQLGFWHELANRHVTSNDDAFHGILLYTDNHDDSKNYNQRVATLKSRGLLPASFSEPPNEAVTARHAGRRDRQDRWHKGGMGHAYFWPNAPICCQRTCLRRDFSPKQSTANIQRHRIRRNHR